MIILCKDRHTVVCEVRTYVRECGEHCSPAKGGICYHTFFVHCFVGITPPSPPPSLLLRTSPHPRGPSNETKRFRPRPRRKQCTHTSRALHPTTTAALPRAASARPAAASEAGGRGYPSATPSPSTSGVPISRSSSPRPSKGRRWRGSGRPRPVTSKKPAAAAARRERSCARRRRRRRLETGGACPRRSCERCVFFGEGWVKSRFCVCRCDSVYIDRGVDLDVRAACCSGFCSQDEGCVGPSRQVDA